MLVHCSKMCVLVLYSNTDVCADSRSNVCVLVLYSNTSACADVLVLCSNVCVPVLYSNTSVCADVLLLCSNVSMLVFIIILGYVLMCWFFVVTLG